MIEFYRERRPKTRRALVDDYLRYYVSAFFSVRRVGGEGGGAGARHGAGGKDVLDGRFLFSPKGSWVLKRLLCVLSLGEDHHIPSWRNRGRGRELVSIVRNR